MGTLGAEAEVDASRVREHLAKITSSRAFAASSRLTRFLRFIVDARLSGDLDRIQEYVLGLEVFDRKESFDPRIDSIVRVEGRRLRQRLDQYYRGEGARDTVRIELPKRGYVPEFRNAPTRRLMRKFPWVATVLVLAALVVWQSGRLPRTADPLTIGVLPFANLSGDLSQEYFVDGITDAMTAELARISTLRVISRTSMMRHKQPSRPLREISRDVGARYLVEGSVMRSGARVRITAQLIDGQSDHHLWAREYDREVTDILRVQGEVVRQIAREIRVQVTPQLDHDLARAPQVQAKAYDDYLKGRFVLRQWTGEAAERAAVFFAEAVAEEPDFALAYAWLSTAHRIRFIMGDAPAVELLPQAVAAARKAVDLAPALADAHFSLAACFAYDGNLQASGKVYARAMELGPNNPDIRHSYAINILASSGRLDEAEVQIRAALTAEPDSLNHRVILGKILYLQRKYGPATAELETVLRMDPTYSDGLRNLAAVYVQRRMHREAIEAHRKAQSLAWISWGEGLLIHALAVAGRRAEADAAFGALMERRRKSHVSALAVATARLGLSETRDVFPWLERALVEKDPRRLFLAVDPMYDSLRSDPRFERILGTAGLR